MNITPKYELILSDKKKSNGFPVNNKFSEKSFLNSKCDSFESSTTTKTSVTFHGAKLTPKQVTEMLNSKSYFKILASLIVATGTTLWTQLRDTCGEDMEMLEDDTINLLTTYVNETLNANKNAVASNNEKQLEENVIEPEFSSILPSKEEVATPKIKKGTKTKTKTVKLENKKQKVPKKIRRVTEENVKLVTDLIQTGEYTQIEVSRKTGIPEMAVSRIVKKYNLQTPKKIRKNTAKNLENEKIIQTFEEYKYSTKDEVARILGITAIDLDKLCQERNIPKFVKTKKIEQLTKEVLIEEFSKGLTTQEIALKYNLKINVVRKAYKEFDLENPNRKQPISIDEDLINEIKRRKANNESLEAIASELGVAFITVSRIVQGKNSTLALELKKYAKQGLTIEQVAEKTGKSLNIIKRVSARYNITFAQEKTKEKSETTKLSLPKINLEELKSIINKKQTNFLTEDDIFFLYPKLEVILTDKAKQLVAKLKEDFAEDVEIIKLLDDAKFYNTIKKMQVTKSGATATGATVRYSNEDLMHRYLAKSYSLFKAQAGEKGVKAFIEKTTVPRVILNKENCNFLKDVWRFKDAEIPYEDPLFEEYRKCFDEKAILLQIETLKADYKKSIIDCFSNPNILETLQEGNIPYLDITPNIVFNIVFQTEDKPIYAKINMPEIKSGGKEADALQKDLINTINNFRQKDVVKEYVDLIRIYNKYCAEEYDQDYAKSLLADLKRISEIDDLSGLELKELISRYQTGKAIEIKTKEKETPELVDYTALTLSELKVELEEIYNKLPQNFNDELRTRILDFTINAKDEDFDNLCEFMYILNDVLNNNLTIEKALSDCLNNNIVPIESGLTEWFLQEKVKKIKQNIIKNYENLPESILNNSKFLCTIYNDINYLDVMSLDELENLDTILTSIQFAINQEEKLDRILDSAVNKKILSKEIKTNDPLKQLVLEELSISNQESFNEALEYLNKIDEYNTKPLKEKVLIANVLNLFNCDGSNIEKKLITQIINTICLENDSVIYNENYGENVTITKELKREFLTEYKDMFIVLKWFEDAAALKADFRGSSGVKELSKTNKDPLYSMEIKIINKNYGQIRFYSVFERDNNGNILKRDKNGNIIRNFVFTKLDKDHNKSKK